MIKYKEYRIEEVLNWQPQKEISPLKIKELSININYKYPFYGQSTLNNGIIDYFSLKEEVLNNKEGKPTILIHSNNQNIVYLDTPFYLKDGHGATSVLQSSHLSENIALYIMTSIKKAMRKKFTYNKKATKIALKNLLISLPINSNNSIDYNYMENFIEKYKKERNKILLLNLEKENLYKTPLTNYEKIAMDDFSNHKILYTELEINELFDIRPTKTYGYTNDKLYKKLGKTPVLSNSSRNNGIGGYVDLEATEKGGIITFSDTTLGSQTIFYQPVNFIGYSHVQGLYPHNPRLWNENSLLYFISVFKKAAGNHFDYSIKFTRDIVSKLIIKLPITSNGEIDFNYMDNFINSCKKNIIKKID